MPIPNFKPGVGRLATDRFDFQNHLDGTNPPGFSDFRHNATQIDMLNPAAAPGGQPTVESALDYVANFIQTQLDNGEGFITVGDGYNTWHKANGLQNFDPSIPSLDTLLNPIFQDIINNVSLPTAFARIQDGGIVVIKAGTYIVKKPIYVPAGITLLGEGYGTKIINASAINTSANDPTPQTPYVATMTSGVGGAIQLSTFLIPGLANGDYVNVSGSYVTGSWQVANVVSTSNTSTFTLQNSTYSTGTAAYVLTMAPVFIVVADPNRSTNDAAVDPNLFMFSQSTQIMNMVISDNFVEPPIQGDLYYKLPQNTTSSALWLPPPLIQQQSGSNLVLDKVTLMGRVAFTSAPTVSSITGSAILWANTWGTAASGTPITPSAVGGTMLKIHQCFIDGFAVPVVINNPNHGVDYLEITESKIRGYGYYNGQTGAGKDALNNLITFNDCNAKISSNILYANASNVTYYLFCGLVSTSPTPPNSQTRGKVLFSSNDLIISQAFAGSPAIKNLYIDSSVSATISNWISVLDFGNNLQDHFLVSVDGVEGLDVSNTNTTVPTLNIPAGDTLSVSGTATIESAGQLNIDGVLNFAASSGTSWAQTASPMLLQVDAAAGSTGNPFSIKAQSSTTYNRIGGNLKLASGDNGASVIPPSAVVLQPATASGAGTLSIYPYQGTIASQKQVNGLYQAFASTASSGSVLVMVIYMPASSMAMIEISWVRRHTSGASSIAGNKAGLVAYCDSSNTVTFNTLTAAYSGTGFDSASNVFGVASTNNLSIYAQSTGNAEDWQFMISVNLG